MDAVFRALGATVAALLVLGNLLAIPVWWWYFGEPVVRLWRRYRARGQKVVE
mgnify:CR=1 FL=1